MAYYSAHYGSWNDPEGVRRVDFGKDRGIPNLYRTTKLHEALSKAQEAANQSGKVVEFCKSAPTGCGMCDEWSKIYPIRSKIKFVRKYEMYRENWYDVVYHSGRVCTYTEPEIPATVERFIESSEIREEQYDKTFHRAEMLYL